MAAAEPNPDQAERDDARPGAKRDLDDDTISRISGLAGVESVIPVVTARVFLVPPDPPVDEAVLSQLRARNGTSTTSTTTAPTRRGPDGDIQRPPSIVENLVGISMAQATKLPITVVAGRLPAAGSSSEVAVTPGYLGRLGLKREEAPAVVGTDVILGSTDVGTVPGFSGGRSRWTRAVVVGVVIQEAAPGQLLAPVEVVRGHKAWSERRGDPTYGEGPTPASPYAGAFVIARGLDQIAPVRERITTIGFATTAPENLIASVQRYLGVVEIVLTAIGLIAVCVAALGITNTLLAAVRERRREIGVLKAIGARDRDVRRVFLIEAGVLGFVGGVLGSAGGWGMAWGVARVVNRYLAEQALPGVAMPFPAVLLVGATVGATVLAIVSGVLPAVRAARLPAREAVAGG